MKVLHRLAALSTLVLSFLGSVVVAQAVEMDRPLSGVPFVDTVSDANKVVVRHTDMQVLRIEGQSMLPFFGEGSVVIVKKIQPEQLRSGMVVVYQNRFGETVAHRLVAQSNEGWVAQGYNNSRADSTVVSSANLVGVVYATFHSNGQLTGLSGLAAVIGRTQVALAAPAK